MNAYNINISTDLSNNMNRQREMLDVLRHRKELLKGEAKLLMTMHLECGKSYRQIARIMGVSTSTIYHRIKRISKLLTGKSFHIYRDCRKQLNKQYKEIARDYFLMGLPILQIAKKHRCSRNKVRQDIEKILSLIEAEKKLSSDEFQQWLIRQYFGARENSK